MPQLVNLGEKYLWNFSEILFEYVRVFNSKKFRKKKKMNPEKSEFTPNYSEFLVH